MWADAKIRWPIQKDSTELALADNIGYDQILVGDIIVVDRVRSTEYMLVVGFDEGNRLVKVSRGYNASVPSAWPKGQRIKIFRVMNGQAEIELHRDDIRKEDGTLDKNRLVDSYLVYEWTPNSTCVPGCYWLEFKLLKMGDIIVDEAPTISPAFTISHARIPSSINTISSISGISNISNINNCYMGTGVKWVRRFPVNKPGFLIRVTDTLTAEL
jgi:hypothetical protein